MFSQMLYLIPIAAMFSRIELNEEFKMEGKLDEELNRLFEECLGVSKRIRLETKIDINVSAVYPPNTSLWTILDSIIVRYQLEPNLVANDDETLTLVLEGG